MIRGSWQAWYWRYDTFADVIEGVEHLYARRVEIKDSPGRELKRLTVAVKGTPEEYSRGWEGTSGRTQRLVLRGWAAMPPEAWPELDDDGRLHTARADFTAAHNYFAVDLVTDGASPPPAHVSIRPLQREAVPLVEAALQEYQAIPADQRRRRKLDLLADDLCAVVIEAYSKLTGKRATVTWNPYARRWEGGLLRLAHVIGTQWDFEACCDGHGRRRQSAFSADRLRRLLRFIT